MKILFISSGNSKNFEIAPFIKIQGESLKKLGIQVDYFRILGKGLTGYLRSGFELRRYLKANSGYDLLHAHYSLSGWAAVVGRSGHKIVLSLMGDDAYGTFDEKGGLRLSSFYLVFLSKVIQPFIDHVISKSENMSRNIHSKGRSSIIPNGVDLEKFTLAPMQMARKELGLPTDISIVLFLGDPDDPRKNLQLACRAVSSIDAKINLLKPFPVSHEKVSLYLNAANCLVFCSTAEGSPNLVKEAMACDCPIVATDVGDVRWVLGEVKGCYVTSYDPIDVAAKLKQALEFSTTVGRTSGRDRIIKLGLDSNTVARRIISVYQKVLASDQ